MTRFIAHRGLSAVHYQNSAAAFKAAADSPFFYGIETDVWYTSDNQWVCCHDNNPFEDSSVSVSKITLEEAQTLPMNPNKLGSCETTEHSYICTMRDYLTICAEGGKVPIIELKCKPTKQQLVELTGIVDEIVGLDNAVFISFHFINMARLRALNSKIRMQVLGKYPTSGRAFLSKGYDIDIMFTFCSWPIILKAHKLGHEVNLWTVNHLWLVKRFMRYGVDYITTNYDFSDKLNND